MIRCRCKEILTNLMVTSHTILRCRWNEDLPEGSPTNAKRLTLMLFKKKELSEEGEKRVTKEYVYGY